MIGVFDSGAGGALTVGLLRKLSPLTDIAFLADRKNAPYGTRSEDEVASLAKRSIARLRALGAERILIACCTASSVYERLGDCERAVSLPIIEPTAARAARLSKSGRIGVLATERTVKSRAFSRAILRHLPSAFVTEIPASPLVPLIEGGMRDGNITEDRYGLLLGLLSPFMKERTDTLVLGCTHFPYIMETVARLLPSVEIISSAHEGAALAARYAAKEQGKILYTE